MGLPHPCHFAAPGAALPAQLPPRHSPRQSQAPPHSSGEDRDAALHPRISPAPGTVSAQATALKPGCEAETDSWQNRIPGWGSQQWAARGDARQSRPLLWSPNHVNEDLKPALASPAAHKASYEHLQHHSVASESNTGFPNPAESSSDVLLL